MEVYDTVIKDTQELLSPYQKKELTVSDHVDWPLLEDNEFLMRKDVAFELGIRTKPSTCFNALTSNEELINEDKIYLIGNDLNEINENTTFSRITFLRVDDIKNPDKAYQNVKRLEFARFRLIPKGYMILSSSMEQKEQVRVSKEAIQNGLDFSKVGSLIINHYKQQYGVQNVQVVFITEELKNIDQLVHQGTRVDNITNAFDHILKNIILDCDMCPLHPICDDVEALREIHFDVNKENENKNKQYNIYKVRLKDRTQGENHEGFKTYDLL